MTNETIPDVDGNFILRFCDARALLLNLAELDRGGLSPPPAPLALDGELHLGRFLAQFLGPPIGVEGDELAAGLAVPEVAVRVGDDVKVIGRGAGAGRVLGGNSIVLKICQKINLN